MDREHFDAIARLVSTQQSRRSAVAALLGAALLGHDPAALARDRRKVKAQAKTKAKAKPKPCYPGKSCIPGKGKNASKCDFSNSTLFQNKDVRGSNLSNSNFTNADLGGADFRGANLSGSCFVETNLLGAKLGGSVNLGNAIFCKVIMPDGSFNTSGCEQATACCPACPPGGECAPEGACVEFDGFCHVLGNPCCNAAAKCEGALTVPGECTTACSNGAECVAKFPGLDVTCDLPCRGRALSPGCCRRQICFFDDDCAHSGLCCAAFGTNRCCLPGQRCTVIGCL